MNPPNDDEKKKTDKETSQDDDIDESVELSIGSFDGDGAHFVPDDDEAMPPPPSGLMRGSHHLQPTTQSSSRMDSTTPSELSETTVMEGSSEQKTEPLQPQRFDSPRRLGWVAPIDVDSFIGADESSSSEGDAESLVELMRASSSGAMSPSAQDKEFENVKIDVLTEDELPAIIPPDLQRHTSSPGAYRAGGVGGVVSPERLRRLSMTPPSIRLSVSTGSLDAPPAPPLNQTDSCTTLVSATLVGEFSETEQSHSVSPGGRIEHLPYAHAEPMFKQRKRLKCIAAWFGLCIVTILVCGLLGKWFANLLGQDDPSSETTTVAVSAVSDSPTAAPLAGNLPDSHQETSIHAVMWGQVTTCNDTQFFTAYPLELQCGGELRVVEAVNAECSKVALAGYSNVTDVSRVACRFEQPKEPITQGFFYQEASAHIIYECIGDTLNDRSSTASLPTMDVSGCESPQESRRRLRTHQTSSPWEGRSRALEDVARGGGASSFVTLGRFCTQEEGQWVLWHQFYRCEQGDRDFFSLLADLAIPAPSDWESLLEWFGSVVEPTTTTTSVPAASAPSTTTSPNGILGDFVISLFEGGGRRLQQAPFTSRNVDLWELLQLAGVRNFCYEYRTCRDFIDSDSCAVSVSPVQASNYDARTSCQQPSDQGPSLATMRRLVDDSLSPRGFIDRISEKL